MLIDLKPIEGKSTSNCFFFTISTLLKYYKKETSLHNACLWNFNFNFNPKLRVEDCLFEDELYLECYDFIKQVTGLSLQVINTKEYRKTVNKFIENKKPVLVHFDSYYCPWGYNYLKYHYDHFFIITGYDKGNYTCVDSFHLDEVALLSEEIFDKGIMHVINHEYENNNMKSVDVIKIVENKLKENTSMIEESKMFKDMIALSDVILEMDKDKEFEGHNDVKTVPLFTKIQNIVLNKNALSNVCEELFEKSGQEYYKEIAKSFFDISQGWNMLLVLLMKFFVTGMNKSRKNSANQLREIVNKEIEIAKQINK